MELDSYQEQARRTMNNGPALSVEQRLANFALGVAGESGEVADYLKKVVFHGHPLDRARLADELGDVLWYIAALASAAELTMSEIAAGNVTKLRRRYPEGFSEADSLRRVDVAREERA
jgi:NTP pyrophosphatase (non-canonical NTP hydrolase)